MLDAEGRGGARRGSLQSKCDGSREREEDARAGGPGGNGAVTSPPFLEALKLLAWPRTVR